MTPETFIGPNLNRKSKWGLNANSAMYEAEAAAARKFRSSSISRIHCDVRRPKPCLADSTPLLNEAPGDWLRQSLSRPANQLASWRASAICRRRESTIHSWPKSQPRLSQSICSNFGAALLTDSASARMRAVRIGRLTAAASRFRSRDVAGIDYDAAHRRSFSRLCAVAS